MSATETYNISTSFSNGVEPGSLRSEISANSNITTTLLQVESFPDNDVCNINFISAISTAEKTELDSIVAAHDPLPTNSSVIIVSKNDDGDYTSIASALTDANDRATSGIRCCVVVYPGTYYEANPMTVGSGVTIMGRGSYLQCVVIGTSPNTHIMELHTRGMIEGISFAGAAGPSGKAIYYDGDAGNATSALAIIREVGVQYCYTGVHVANGRSTKKNSLTIQTLGIKTNPSQPVNTAILVDNDAELLAVNVRTFSNDTTPLGTTLHVSGSGAHCLMTDSIIDGGTTGVKIDTDAQCEVRSTHIRDVDNGIIVTGTGAQVDVTNSKIQSNTWDIDIQATSVSSLSLVGSDMNMLGINNPNQLGITGIIYDDQLGDNGVRVLGELVVGSITHPAEAVFGSGDSYTHTMSVQTNTDNEVGTWNDISSSMTDLGANTSTAFAGLTTGNCLYIGSDYKFHGLKIHVDSTALPAADVDNIILEYHNGTSWVEISSMWSDAEAPYYTHSYHAFPSTNTGFQVRFNCCLNWGAKHTCNSVEKYWIRYRITSDISTNPLLDKIKVHSSRTEINSDGFLEYFGKARSITVMPWDLRQFYQTPIGTTATNQDLYISDNIGIAGIQNVFGTAADNSVTYSGFVPFNMDTSSGMRCKIAFMCPDANTGNIRWEARWGFSDGSSWKVYTNTTDAPSSAPKEYNAVGVIAAPAEANKVSYMSMNLDVRDLSSNPNGNQTIGWMTLTRTSSHVDDTYASNVYVINIQASYVQWANGSHTTMFSS